MTADRPEAERRPIRTVVIGALVMVAFVAATNPWTSELSPDALEYEKIALAAPGLPDTEIGSAFTERLVSPWIAGVVGDLLPGGVRTAFWIIVGLSVLAMVGFLIDICRRLELRALETLLCVGLLVLNANTLRLYLQNPGPVDPLLVAGTAVLIWALVSRRLAVVALGAFVSICARQTALLSVPAAMTWLWAGQGWSSRPKRDRLLLATAIVAGTIVLYGGMKLIASSFTFAFAPSVPGDTVLPVLGDPGTASQLVGKTVRVAAPLVPVLGCIAGVLAGLAWSRKPIRLPIEFWCALLIAAAIVVQPLLISPNFHGFFANQARLSALGVLPLCVALAYALRAGGVRLAIAPVWAVAGGAALLAITSLNDQYSVIGPSGNGQFLAIQLAATLFLAALIVWVSVAADRDPTT